jgi:hypothetical protein
MMRAIDPGLPIPGLNGYDVADDMRGLDRAAGGSEHRRPPGADLDNVTSAA